MLSRLSDSVQVLINISGDGDNFGGDLVFNHEQVLLVSFCDEVDSETKVAESARPTNSMQVGVGVHGEVEVDYHIDSLDIDTPREQIRAD